MKVERLDFVLIPIQDAERAKRFYGETLGLELERDTPNGAEFKAGQVTLELWNPTAAGREFKSAPNELALRVADVAAARAELEAKGVEFTGETFDTGVCHMAFFSDPDGNALMLHRRYAP
jgi:catechol 2,3-dioxygenase-like lactoylglutathione lyase family enzyme